MTQTEEPSAVDGETEREPDIGDSSKDRQTSRKTAATLATGATRLTEGGEWGGGSVQ